DNTVQVLLYTSYLHVIGGIETFVLQFIELMGPYYKIGVLCPVIPPEMASRISAKVPFFKGKEEVSCDTLIMIRMMDKKPVRVRYKKTIRMCHACKSDPEWAIIQDCDELVHVSKASRQSFDTKGKVILNPLVKTEKKALLFVSATRVPALDKGRNADRMLALARKLQESGIAYMWLNFSDEPLRNAPRGFINVGTYHELQPYIAKADYLVQLSDQEGFGYSVVEALANNTAVICTPFATTKELGVIDGKNGYIVPFNLDFDINKLLKVPQFSYEYDNDKIRKQWQQLIDKKPKRKSKKMVEVRVLTEYTDIELGRDLKEGQTEVMTEERAGRDRAS
ncbi:MAG: glycosyltransferase, partial [Butyrivibrio sp.]|nr:glycosyltransferase [Butyrivibrio sp.]